MNRMIFNTLLAGGLLAATAVNAQQNKYEIRGDKTVIPEVKASASPLSPSPMSFSGTNTWDGLGAGTGGSNNCHFGYLSGAVNTAGGSTFVGSQSGYNHTTGYASTFIGLQSGLNTTSASWGTFVGHQSGYANTSGFQNTFVGSLAGNQNSSGSNNTAVGHYSGGYNTIGYGNVYLGSYAGLQNTGSNNTIIGLTAGWNNTSGSGNIFIGSGAGYNETGSNRLYIDNSSTATPLIFGDFSIDKLVLNGKTSIGTSNQPASVGGANTSAYNLFVKGGILADEVRVRTGWADYVFDKNYHLKPLSEVEAFIGANGHLPNVPAAAQVESDGISLGDMARIQQEKIEELTLYVIAQEKQLKVQQQEIAALKAMLKKIIQ